jgi:Cu-Zn family superoxide dismutase
MKTLAQALLGTALTALIATIAVAQERMVDISKVSEAGAGKHGFHLHENGDCAAGAKDDKMEAGGVAGGHYDPASTKSS